MHSGTGILSSLVRVEKVLREVAPEQAELVQDLIVVARTLPPPTFPPLRCLAKQLKQARRQEEPFLPQEEPSRVRPARAPRKRHLRIVPPPLPPPKLEPIAYRKEVPPDPIGDKMREAEGARALLLEIIRRAAYDWVLYRSSTRIDQKILAEDAYTWLFVEDEDHPHWKVRKDDEKLITGFMSICDALDLNPNKVRQYVKVLTPNRVMSSGRPPENSRSSDHAPNIAIHTRVQSDSGTGESIDFDAIINQLLDFDG